MRGMKVAVCVQLSACAGAPSGADSGGETMGDGEASTSESTGESTTGTDTGESGSEGEESEGGEGPQTCGDGALDVGEECDDGNLEPGDGCEFDCTCTRGKLEWEHLAAGENESEALDVDVTPDGGFVMVGSVWDDGPVRKTSIVRLDADGAPMWSISEIVAGMQSTVFAVAVAPSGTIAIGGAGFVEEPASDGCDSSFVRTLTPDGALGWTLDAEADCRRPEDVAWTASGDLMVLRRYPTIWETRSWVERLGADGQTIWSTDLEGADMNALAVGPNGTSLVVGWHQDDQDVIAVDADGSPLWTFALEQTGARGVAVGPTGEVRVVGTSWDTNLGWIVALDAQGLEQWSRTLPWPDTSASDVVLAADAGLYVAGSIGDDALMLRLSAQGDKQWAVLRPGPIGLHPSVARSESGDAMAVAGSIGSRAWVAGISP